MQLLRLQYFLSSCAGGYTTYMKQLVPSSGCQVWAHAWLGLQSEKISLAFSQPDHPLPPFISRKLHVKRTKQELIFIRIHSWGSRMLYATLDSFWWSIYWKQSCNPTTATDHHLRTQVDYSLGGGGFRNFLGKKIVGLGTKWFSHFEHIFIKHCQVTKSQSWTPQWGFHGLSKVLNGWLPPLALGLVKLNGVPLRVFDMEFVFESNLGGVKSNLCCRYLSFGNQKHQCHSWWKYLGLKKSGDIKKKRFAMPFS